jgi:hypothetical protein
MIMKTFKPRGAKPFMIMEEPGRGGSVFPGEGRFSYRP